jgi:hypothetical protein
MFLEYLALAILLLGLTAVFYTFIYIHDIPYDIAKRRNHPQKEAIHVACWLSLFTLHAIWPIVFIWAVSKQDPEPGSEASGNADMAELRRRLGKLEAQLLELKLPPAVPTTKAGRS